MKNKVKQIGGLGLIFGTGLASHCLGSTPESSAVIASTLGLSTHVAQGIFTLSSHILAHGVYESLVKVKESFIGDVNYDLETAILNAYKESFAKIEKDLIEEYKVKEKRGDKLIRYIFKKDNKDHEDLVDLKQGFLAPLMKALTNNEVIAEMFEENRQLNPDDFLKKIIKNATPDYDKKDSKSISEFVDIVCEKFKKYFRHYFLQELKKEDKAKTVYFTHLLETILQNTSNGNKEFSIIKAFANQTNIRLQDVFEKLCALSESNYESKTKFEIYNIEVLENIKSIKEKINNIQEPFLSLKSYKTYQNKNNIYDFKYQYLDFVGRASELNMLLDFIGSEDDSVKFRWWLIKGPGGIGKSRIAQQVCMISTNYHAGFLEFRNISALPNWTNWQPHMPTIIVIDYAFLQSEKVAELIEILAERNENLTKPVRLLLIDREETEEWKIKIRSGTIIDHSYYRMRDDYASASLNLKPLQDNDCWEIIAQVLKDQNIKLWEKIKDNKTRTLEFVLKLDKSRRPLFIFLIAMALSEGKNIISWNVNDLLGNTLIKFRSVWLKQIQDYESRRKVDSILLVNTLCGKLNKSQLVDLLKKQKLNFSFSEFCEYYNLISDRVADNSEIVWEGIQPDILGEFYILTYLSEELKDETSKGKKNISKIISLATEINLRNTVWKIFLVWNDFYNSDLGFNAEALIVTLQKNLLKNIENIESRRYLEELLDNKGHVYRARGQLTEAFESFDNEITLDPDNGRGYNNRGLIKTEMDLHESAISDFDIAITQDSKNAMFYFNRGLTKAEMQLYESSIEDFNIAIKIAPQFGAAYYNRGSIKKALKIPDFIEDVHKAMELNYLTDKVYFLKALYYFEIGDYQVAVNDFTKGLIINPEDKYAYLIRGECKSRLNLFEEAIQDYDKAIELGANDTVIYGARGSAKFILNKHEDAIKDLDISISLDPTVSNAYVNRACAYQGLHKFKESIPDFDKAIDLGVKEEKDREKIGRYYFLRGFAYFVIGEIMKALDDYYKGMLLGDEDAKEQFFNLFSEPVTPGKYKRNEIVTVGYSDGVVKSNVKYKTIEDEIKARKCIVLTEDPIFFIQTYKNK